MKINIYQFKTGLVHYIDQEILPKLTGWRKVVATGYFSLAVPNLEETIHRYKDHALVKMTGAVCDDGEIEIDRVHSALHDAITEPFEIPLPVIGNLRLDRSDIDKLVERMKDSYD